MAKKVSLYGILTALCLIFGYIESLISFSFIAPGIKLGLANSVAIILVARKDIKGAFAVNITRILISALLFATPFSLLFSLTAGFMSILIMIAVSRFSVFGITGISICGAAVHNITQLTVASLVFGQTVWYYLPVMLAAAVVTGTAMGLLCDIILKKVKTNNKL